MTWQLGSFAVLGIALAGGFAWYERSCPNARIIALVGTLAAFAALGRIAFAALPNVKPTTDIVLISGYALGGAPGFVVGALAGLTSNFFFGQGPWTPWQMAAWGATGALGAGVALARMGAGGRTSRGPRVRLGGRTSAAVIGRWPLALVCAAAGFAFAALQDVGDWVTYSDHSAAQLGIYVGRGVGFDCIHAAGCFAFALAFGPPLARSLQRFATRLHVTWGSAEGETVTSDAPVGSPSAMPSAAALAPAVLAALMLTLGAGVFAPAGARAATPASYLLAAQNRDGGLGPAPSQPSSQLYSGWAALALAGSGSNPADVSQGGASLLDYVRSGAASLSDLGALERTILVAGAAGGSATSFAGQDLLGELERQIRADGSLAEQVNLTSFAILALRSAGVTPSVTTLSWLARQQDGDGGFSFATAGGASDVDDTGAALQALAGAGVSAADAARSRAVAFIRGQQNQDGGFPAAIGGESNAQSTAWAVQGLIAAGVDPGSLRRGGAGSPLAFLDSLIEPDGHVRYSRTSDQTPVWVTAQAELALAGNVLPLAPVASARHHSASRGATAGAPKRAQRRHGASRRSRTGTASASPLVAVAAAAGVLTALALAPLGRG